MVLKKLLFIIIFLLSFMPVSTSYSDELNREQKLVDIMEKAIVCTVAYNYQLRFASVAMIIVPLNNPRVSVDALLQASSNWIKITEQIQNTLKNDYGHLQAYLSRYKNESLQLLSGRISTEFLTLTPDKFIEKLFKSTKGCPNLAIEARDLLKDKDNSTEPDRTKPRMPKRKM
tara:strand:+ start:3099 stop:3617 length:519 start_codon:yes stop_codon:yes gene_type:complete